MGDTAEMWGDMLGIGPVLQALKDPQFFAQMNQLFVGLIELDKRTIRLEAVVNAIAERIGVDIAGVGVGPAVPPGNGPNGQHGGSGAAGVAADDGNGVTPPARRIA